MPPTPFLTLAALGERIGGTRRRLELTRLLGEFLRGLQTEEVGPAVLLLLGRVCSEGEDRELALSGRTLWKVLAGVFPRGGGPNEEALAEAADIGESAKILGDKRDGSVFPRPGAALTDCLSCLCIFEPSGLRGSRRAIH
jgi:hypothetical protein